MAERSTRARLFAALCAAAAALSLTGLAGGVIGSVALTRVHPDLPAIAPATAITGLLLAIALGLATLPSRVARGLAASIAAFLAVCTVLLLVVWLADGNAWVLQLADHAGVLAPFIRPLAYPAPNTTLAMLLTASGILIGARSRGLTVGCHAAAGLIALTSLVALLYGVTQFAGMTQGLGMSVYASAIVLALNGAGVVRALPPQPMLAGDELLRVALPLTAVVPIALGIVRSASVAAGWVDEVMAAAIAVAASMGITAGGLIWAAVRLDTLERARRAVVAQARALAASEEQRTRERDRERAARGESEAALRSLERAHEALRHSEERFRRLADALDGMIWIVDHEGETPRVVYVSPGFERLSGRSIESVMADFTVWREALHPEDQARVAAAVRQVLTTGAHEVEYRIVRPDGSVRWLHDRGTRLGGTRAQVVSIALDITEQKRTAQALADARARLEGTLNAAEVGTWTWNLETDRINGDANLAALFGLPADAASQVTVDAFLARLHPDDRAAVRAALETALHGSRPMFVEARVQHGDDGWRWIAVKGRVLADDGGRRTFNGVVLDISERKALAAALDRTSRLLQAVSENVPDLIYVKDRAGRMVFASPPLFAFIGRPREEVLGHTDAEWSADPTDAAVVAANDERVMREGCTAVLEESYTGANGRRIFLSTKAPFRDASGDVIGLVGVSTDITERKRTEQALRESEAEFRAVFELASVGKAQADPATGRLLRVNRRLCELAGRSEAELLGLRFTDITHPDDRAAAWARFEALTRGDLAEYLVEKRLVRPDGRIAWVQMSAALIRDPEGRPWRTVAVLLDITERREAEEALRYQLDLVKTITDNTPACLLMVDADLRVTFANPATEAVTGYRPEELVGRVLHDALHHTRRDGTPFPIAECPIHGALPQRAALRNHDDTFIRKDGTFFPVSCNALPVLRAGAPTAMVIEVRDVTESRRALEELRDADRRKDEFLAMLAHELRNPLAPIRNAVAVLRAITADDARAVRARNLIERQVAHLTLLVDDLLEASRITRGTIELRREPLLLSQVVEEAIETARPSIEQHGHTLTVSLAPEPIGLEADRARLVQVISNLLGNAAKFTPPGGRIAVCTARTATGEAELRVRDTGIGIPAGLHERIFELFAQEESSLARSQGGLGIGLTLVKRLVELHGGRISVSSGGRGLGAEFTVTLPALPPVPAPRRSAGEAAATDTGPRGLRLLVVEDNTDAAESFQLLLELAGHEVRVAHHGRAALALLDSYVPDVAFIDLGLPEIDGFDLARQLRTDPRTAGMLLVAVTGYGRDEDKQRARDAGFDHHLTKPVDFAIVTALLAARRPAARTVQSAAQ